MNNVLGTTSIVTTHCLHQVDLVWTRPIYSLINEGVRFDEPGRIWNRICFTKIMFSDMAFSQKVENKNKLNNAKLARTT
jgi:hypothetical protein